MYKDKNYQSITIGCVVKCFKGYHYYVEGIDNSREYAVKCRNSCIVAYYKPEQLEVLI